MNIEQEQQKEREREEQLLRRVGLKLAVEAGANPHEVVGLAGAYYDFIVEGTRG